MVLSLRPHFFIPSIRSSFFFPSMVCDRPHSPSHTASEDIRTAARRVVTKWKKCVLPSRKRALESEERPSLQLYPKSLLQSSRSQKRPKSGSSGAEKAGQDFVPLNPPSHEYHEDRSPSDSQKLRAELDKLFPDGFQYKIGDTGDATRDKVCEVFVAGNLYRCVNHVSHPPRRSDNQ